MPPSDSQKAQLLVLKFLTVKFSCSPAPGSTASVLQLMVASNAKCWHHVERLLQKALVLTAPNHMGLGVMEVTGNGLTSLIRWERTGGRRRWSRAASASLEAKVCHMQDWDLLLDMLCTGRDVSQDELAKRDTCRAAGTRMEALYIIKKKEEGSRAKDPLVIHAENQPAFTSEHVKNCRQ